MILPHYQPDMTVGNGWYDCRTRSEPAAVWAKGTPVGGASTRGSPRPAGRGPTGGFSPGASAPPAARHHEQPHQPCTHATGATHAAASAAAHARVEQAHLLEQVRRVVG